jgi:hypothetical protein
VFAISWPQKSLNFIREPSLADILGLFLLNISNRIDFIKSTSDNLAPLPFMV